MLALNIDALSIPAPVKQKLHEMSGSISFEKQSSKGANGLLFFGTNLLHKQRVAVKFYDWGGDPQYHAEPQYIASLRSANIITVMDAAYVDSNFAYFVTPYYQRGDLDIELKQGVQANVRAISLVRDILSGLSHLHTGNLLHRDLKPQNIFLSDDDYAVIGDFGSVKQIPQGQAAVTGSGHSLIYRPPESIQIGSYGIPGDIYQVGIVLYQLLGGSLPYDESAWLNPKQLKLYKTINDQIERQIFATKVIENRISQGRIVTLDSLPPWVCIQLRRTISKACSLDPRKRYRSCAEFLARIMAIRQSIRDWRFQDNCAICSNGKSYRIVFNQVSGAHHVQKLSAVGWRKDNSFSSISLKDLVAEIEQRN